MRRFLCPQHFSSGSRKMWPSAQPSSEFSKKSAEESPEMFHDSMQTDFCFCWRFDCVPSCLYWPRIQSKWNMMRWCAVTAGFRLRLSKTQKCANQSKRRRSEGGGGGGGGGQLPPCPSASYGHATSMCQFVPGPLVVRHSKSFRSIRVPQCAGPRRVRIPSSLCKHYTRFVFAWTPVGWTDKTPGVTLPREQTPIRWQKNVPNFDTTAKPPATHITPT